MSKNNSGFNPIEFQATAEGISPERDDLTFEISTEDVYKFLDKRLNFLLEKLRQTGKYNLPDMIGESKLVAIPAGKYYIPFIMMLPPSLLEKEARKKGSRTNDDSVLSIYKAGDEDGTQRMIPEVYSFFKFYMYTKEDINAFKTPQTRQSLGITSSMTPVLKQLSVPSVRTLGNKKDDGKRAVFLLIDPMRVFHEMLVNKANPNEHFRVKIEKFKRVKDGSYIFTIKRKVQKKEAVKTEFMKELQRLIKG